MPEAGPQTPPNRPPTANRLFVGIHSALAGLLVNPLLAVPAFSPHAQVGGAAGMALWVVSLALLGTGAILLGVGLRDTRRRGLVAGGLVALVLVYAVLALVADLLVGRLVPLHVTGETRAAKADIYGWALEPNHALTAVHPDTLEVTVERTNSQGWRDIEQPREKTRPRILLLGDSQVYGHGVTLEHTIGRQLERQLDGAFQVVSMGMGGYGTDQQYLVLLNEGLEWQPDYVVLVFTVGNDVMDNMHDVSFMGSAPKPAFDLVDGQLVQRPFNPLRLRGPGAWLRRSNISRLVRALVQARTARENPQGLRVPGGHEGDRVRILAENMSELEDFANDYSGYALFKPRADWSPKLERGWELTLALLRAMRDASTRAGATFVLYPNFQHPEGFVFEIERDGQVYELDAHGPFAMLRAFAKEEGIEHIDEPDEMKWQAARGELSFANDGHYSEKGTAAAAERIAETIRRLHADRHAPPAE
ncbi:MAG: SGNH/GDSL hydrolase family protein [Candidatus Sumerlaeia bacterium]|nr:SGNH/GDSL hydrolase family protein [Candidatus Sumerlaeia bacterium]